MPPQSRIDPTYEAALRRALDLALAYIGELDRAPVRAKRSSAELRERLAGALPDAGLPAEAVVSRLANELEGGLNGNAGGRFFGWVVGGCLPSALAADWLTSTWDQVPGSHAVAPGACVIEELCGRWLLSLLGLPEAASFAIVTGCQMAHFTCLAAARNHLLAARGWDVEARGLWGAPQLRLVTGDQRHGTIERAVRMLGFGKDSIVDVPVDARGQLEPSALEAALERNAGAPAVVSLQAGDVNTGAFDPFRPLIEVAHRWGAWVHVDGAFGLWAAASDGHRHLTEGVENADSWATDGHKWLNVPYDCGYAFVRHAAAHYRAFSHRAAYLELSEDHREPVDWTPEHSRRARALPTYAALLALGRRGVAQLVSDSCRHARELVGAAARLPGVEVLAWPVINQGLIRFLDDRPAATEADHDRRTESVMGRINASGEALFTSTVWSGKRCMRISVSSWKTTDADVRRAAQAIAASL